jgi:hypothetical protein
MDTNLVQQLKNTIAAAGYSTATFAALEFANGAPIADTDALVAILDPVVAAKDWLTGYTINHAQLTVTFIGPTVPYVP